MSYAVLRRWFNGQARAWLDRRVPPARRVELLYRTIFILPTAAGFFFLLIAAVVFLLAVNYVISLAFALAFLMTAVFISCMFYCYRNLQGLHISATKRIDVGPVTAAFPGEMLICPIQLKAAEGKLHQAIETGFKGQADGIGMTDALAATTWISLQMPAGEQRGNVRLPRLIVRSVYPLGLFRAWAEPDLAIDALVYPRPVRPPHVAYRHTGKQLDRVIQQYSDGSEDFQGLRDYRRGDSLSRIAWKSVGRAAALQVKEFAESRGETLILDWSLFPASNSETRLSYLCYLALLLEDKGAEYGLRLPGVVIEAGTGQAHLHEVLRELAVWQAAE